MGLWVFSVEDIPQPQWAAFTETGMYICIHNASFNSLLCDVSVCMCVVLPALALLNLVFLAVDNIPDILCLLQMAFLHLWHKEGCPQEREGQTAMEELKVPIFCFIGFQCTLSDFLLSQSVCSVH